MPLFILRRLRSQLAPNPVVRSKRHATTAASSEWVRQRTPWTQEKKDQLVSLINTSCVDKMEGDWNRVLRRINSISIRSPDSMTQEDYDRLVAHVQEKYMIPEIKTDWVEVGKAFGLSPKLCSVAYRQQILAKRTQYLESKRGFGSLKEFSDRALNLRASTRCGMVKYLKKIGMHWTTRDIYKLAIAWNTGFQSLKQGDDYGDLSTQIGSSHSSLECRKVLAIMCQRQLHLKARMPASQVRAAASDEVWTAEEIETVNSLIREQFEQKGRCSVKAFVRQVMSRFPDKDPVSVNSVVQLQRRRERFKFYTNRCREAQARLSRINDEKGRVDEDDFRGVSKAFGLSVYVCRKNYTDQLFVIERRFRLWTKTETELLLESVRDQKKQQQQQQQSVQAAAAGKGIGISWKVAAAHVGTRTRCQCCTKYYTLLRQNPSILLD
ncbi:hypothetical protein GGH99_000894 [Coemansia sp. RSA 1285]|nr:hypothetical protein GGH99_000894 [Coemansia sp. RSA 1285]